MTVSVSVRVRVRVRVRVSVRVRVRSCRRYAAARIQAAAGPRILTAAAAVLCRSTAAWALRGSRGLSSFLGVGAGLGVE